MLVTSLNVVKNFVLLGDAQHSVQFVRYKDEVRNGGRVLVIEGSVLLGSAECSMGSQNPRSSALPGRFPPTARYGS